MAGQVGSLIYATTRAIDPIDFKPSRLLKKAVRSCQLDEVEEIVVSCILLGVRQRPTKTLASAMPSPSVGLSEQLG